ncbi:hypothetical protein HW555_009707 [Spodoptera exigua]|uniref:Probable U3 small nucleolar RNA-associated protein 11 n=2 Tax=Spodoptera exigua TaxID=7107 RepID=A0A835L0I2_SPOEX|nr:hypothetical protein HW555_009707 [Spodoptera exigua]
MSLNKKPLVTGQYSLQWSSQIFVAIPIQCLRAKLYGCTPRVQQLTDIMTQSKVSKAIQQYFRNTTLHGFKYLRSVHYVDRVVWVVWCCASAWCAGSLCVVLWRRYLQVPALLVLCDDARALSYSRFGVPTVAVCLPPHVVADMFLHRLSPNSTLTEQIPSSLARALAGKSTLKDQLLLLDNLLTISNTTLAHMMMNYAPNCDEEMIIKCRYQKRMVPCQQLFEKKLTYWGVCCVMRPEKLLPKFNRGLVKKSPTMQSLELVLQCRRGSNASICQFVTFYKGEDWVQPNILHPSNYYMAHLVFTLIPNEPTSLVETTCLHDPDYSRTLCMRRCAEKACGCRDPLYMQPDSDKDLPICSTARLTCLRAYDLKQHENISCSCLPPCRKITTTMVLESSPMNQINNTIDNLYSGIDVSRSVVVNLRVNLHHSQVFLLNPTETWVTLLSSLGGVFNMFLGVGLFTALELIYFLMIKLPVAIKKSAEFDYANKKYATTAKAAKANQKTHKERHQPESRKHLGLLEKKKDYKKRADDYHEKGETLKLLRKRTLDKNPDEFYFHMINSRVKDGEHHEVEKEDEHSKEQVKLMQTQDLKYINMKRTIESRRINRLQAQLHMTDVAEVTPNTHTFFVEEGEEKDFDLAKRLDTHPALLGRKSNRPRLSDLDKLSLPDISDEALESMKKKKQKIYSELSKRIEREKELTVIQQKMELKRHLQDVKIMKPKRLKPGTKSSAPVYQFQYMRKKQSSIAEYQECIAV